MSDTTTRAVDRAIAEAILTEWANKSEEYDEWHRDHARLFLMLDDPAQDYDYALGALAYWAMQDHRYNEPHRTAANAFWTWYG